MPNWDQLQTEGWGPSVTHGWATQPRWGETSAAMVRRILDQYSSLYPSPTHLSPTRNITLWRIKCERYIFIKKCIRSFIEVRHYVWLCSAYICICTRAVVCDYTTHWYWLGSSYCIWKGFSRLHAFITTNVFHGTLGLVLCLDGMHSAAASKWALTKISYSSFGVGVPDISWSQSNSFLSINVCLSWISLL